MRQAEDIILRDDIRPQSAAVIGDLRLEGLRSVVLTGDNLAAAEYLRTELKLDDVRAGLKPEEKVAAIRALSAQGNRVAMIVSATGIRVPPAKPWPVRPRTMVVRLLDMPHIIEKAVNMIAPISMKRRSPSIRPSQAVSGVATISATR